MKKEEHHNFGLRKTELSLKGSGILSYIQKHRAVFTWAAIFLIFLFASMRHANFGTSIFLVLDSMIPLTIMAVILKKILIPRFLHRHRWMYYIHCLIVLTILVFIAVQSDLIIYKFVINHGWLTFPAEIVESMNEQTGRVYLHAKYAFLLISTITVITISQLLDEREKLNGLMKEHQMQQELKYLRAQINPHFLFNALNCIYSLTMLKDDQAPDSVLKLSEMLRYVIDDCRTDTVKLSKEIAYINNYIDFQRIRMEKDPDITFECKIQDENFLIPPMIFQPMVENCFKHSRIIDDPKAFIHINLTEENGHIKFCTENSIHVNEYKSQDNERTGIGIINVRQRLELLFQDKFTFNTSETDNVYKTELYI